MKDLVGLVGLPLEEAQRFLTALGERAVVRPTGEVGRTRTVRRCERDGLVETEPRVVRIRRNESEVELVAAPTYRRPGL